MESKLFELFTSEYIRITLLKNHKQSIEHKGTIKVVESSMVAEGYLIEEDDTYLFLSLGPTSDLINVAVVKKQISTIEICDPNEERDEELNEMFEDNKDMN